jgi:hypothetical protein
LRDFDTPVRRQRLHISAMLSNSHLVAENASRHCEVPLRGAAPRLRRSFRVVATTGNPSACDVIPLSWQMAAPQPIPTAPDHRRKVDTSPRLIAADAALMLVERWRTELVVLRRRSPTSDAVKTLSDCVDELSAAITAGHAVTVQLTVSEAHSVSHIPVSTLRWLCKHKPEVIGARKREGVWYIDRAHFERYLVSPDGRATVLCDEDQETSPAPDRVIPLLRQLRADVGTELR